MMTRDEAIRRFEKQLTDARVVLNSGFGTREGECDTVYRNRKEMAEIALDALRRTAERDKAREDGRLVELPCKVESFVFVSPNNGKSFHKAKLYSKSENGSHLVQLCDDLLQEDEKHIVASPLSRIFYDWFFKIYTRQEAEAALGGGESE